MFNNVIKLARTSAGVIAIATLICNAGTTLDAREIRAIFLDSPSGSPNKAYLFSEREQLEIELPRRFLSKGIRIPQGELKLAVFKERPNRDTVAQGGFQTITIPADWSRCILLFLPTDKYNGFPARVVPIDASTGKFPKGHTRVINLTNNQIAGQFGGLYIKVAPAEQKTLSQPREGQGGYRVEIASQAPGSEKPFFITRTSWMHYPDRRQFLFALDGVGRSKTPRLWIVHDFEMPN